MSTISKITSQETFDELVSSSKQAILYFTIRGSKHAQTKEILDEMYKNFEEFVEKNTSETKFGVLDLVENQDLADTLKASALSSFHGFVNKKLVSKTGQTKDIKDLEELISEIAEPEKILPYKATSQEDFDEILKNNEFVVVDFTATWCGPCQGFAPIFKNMAKKQRDSGKNMLGTEKMVKFVKVEQTENKEIMEKAGVSCYPSFYLYKNGEKVDKLEGADENSLKLKIKTMIDPEYVEIHYAEYSKTLSDLKKQIEENDVVFLDFTASWCPPCKMIGPVFEELAESLKDKSGVKFLKVDVDDNEEAGTEFKVRSMPTFKVFKAGKEVPEDGFGGASVEKLKAMVEKYAK